MSKVLEITDSNFSEIIASNETVMIDFWATWCGPCQMIKPIVEEMAGDFEGKAVIGKLDVDENPQISAQFGIRSIPTLLFFKNGVLVDKVVGAAAKNTLTSKLQGAL